MTMTSYVYVRGPVNPEKLFRFVQSLLSAGPQEDYHRAPGEPFVRRDGSTYLHESHLQEGEWGNHISQGLPALMEVTYGPDGPLSVRYYDCQYEMDAVGSCYCEAGDEHEVSELRAFAPYCARVMLDTAYGYEASNGANCGDLHAFLITSIAAWLATQPGEPGFVWSNGETGITSDTLDGVSRLGDAVLGIPEGSAVTA